jgi:small GTP-binding protein
MKDQHYFDMIIKIVIIGDSAVGKSKIVSRYTRNIFQENTKSTIGVEYGNKILVIDGVKIKVQIWDTAGQEKYKSLTNAYYKSAKGAIIVFDLNLPISFDNVDVWYNELGSKVDEECIIFLVGNKVDLPRKITQEQGIEKAERNNMHYIETSACTTENINQLFELLINGSSFI